MEEEKDSVKVGPMPQGIRLDLLLFWSFFKIVLVVVGGGYAIIAAAEREFVGRRRWLSEEDFSEMMTVILTVPGLLAINSSVYLGWKLHRFTGAVAAVFGALLPSVTLIMLIAAGLSQITDFLQTPWVQGAFKGVLCGIIALLFTTALKLRKSGIHDLFDLALALAAFAGLSFFKCNPVYVVLAAIAAGMMKVWYGTKRKKA